MWMSRSSSRTLSIFRQASLIAVGGDLVDGVVGETTDGDSDVTTFVGTGGVVGGVLDGTDDGAGQGGVLDGVAFETMGGGVAGTTGTVTGGTVVGDRVGMADAGGVFCVAAERFVVVVVVCRGRGAAATRA